MSIKIGNMIRVIAIDNKYFGRNFTVVYIDGNVYECCCGLMKRHLFFSKHDVGQIDSLPRFPPGTVVLSKIDSYPFCGTYYGIVEVSNHLGSMVRVWDENDQQHIIQYVSNRNLKVK